MGKNVRITCFLLGLSFFSYKGVCQEIKTIPNALLRPERGEAPRYPRDIVIGELGQGEASGEAYQFARNLLSALTAGAIDAPVLAGTRSLITESLIGKIKSLAPNGYRLGGGRTGPDGNVSFLLRFLGAEESITGELFIKLEKIENMEMDEVKTERWSLDDLILEEKMPLRDIRDSYRYDFSPYERFF